MLVDPEYVKMQAYTPCSIVDPALLYGDVKEKLYIHQPECFAKGDESLAWCLIQTIYGLKQAGRCLQEKLNKMLVKQLGFTQMMYEQSMWTYQKYNASIIIIIFVDDMMIVSKSESAAQKVRNNLRGYIKLRDFGSVF